MESVEIRRLIKLVLVIAVLSIITGFYVRPLWEDEVEHLHAAYLVKMGETPYVDFFQNHPPTIHLIVSGIIQYMPRGLSCILISRFMIMGILVCAALVLASVIPKEDRIFYWLILVSVPIYWVCYHLRADPFMILAVALHIKYVHRWIEKEKYVYLALAGLFIGISGVFLPKSVMLIIGLPLFMLINKKMNHRLKNIVIYGLSSLIFPIILVAYLGSQGILKEFIENVFLSNSRHIFGTAQYSKLSPWMPNIPLLLFWIFGSVGLWSQRNKTKILKFVLLMEIYIFLAFIGYFCAPFGWQYNLALWVVCIAVISAVLWENIVLLCRKSARRLIPIVILLALVLPPFMTFGEDIAKIKDTQWRYDQFKFITSKVNRDQPVIAIAPLHPIFNLDSIHIYHPWQFYFASQSETVQNRWFEGWMKYLEKQPPDLIDLGYLATIISLSNEPDDLKQTIQSKLYLSGYKTVNYNGRQYAVINHKEISK